MAGVLARDVKGVWICEVRGIAIRQGHFQNYALALRNRNTREFQGLLRLPREGMYGAAIAEQFFQGPWRQMWFGTETHQLRGMFQQGEPGVCQKIG